MGMLKIGNVEIENRFILAPMAAVNCTAQRLLAKKNGAGLVYTQMIDADKIENKTDKEIQEYLNILDNERPVSVQLAGFDLKNLKRAVKLIEPYADIIDFNVGCILENQIGKGSGAYLLRNPELLEERVKLLIKESSKPVTCKIRIGWDAQTINAVKICQMLEKCGVSAIAIHGRTVQQKYGKKSNWTIMKQVKEKSKIPIIANGDITTYEEGLELLKKTGCDFVMIGREAKHAPWVFNKNFKKTNENVKAEILEFINLYEKFEKRDSITELTQHVFWLFRDIKTSLRAQWVRECKTYKEVRAFLDRID